MLQPRLVQPVDRRDPLDPSLAPVRQSHLAGRALDKIAAHMGPTECKGHLALAKASAATHRMGEKLASPAGKARYAQRKWPSEAPNGWIKEVLGFRRFSLRGLAKVRGEWDLVCLALNIKRMGTVATC